MKNIYSETVEMAENPNDRSLVALILVNEFGFTHRELHEPMGVTPVQANRYWNKKRELPSLREKALLSFLRQCILETLLAKAQIILSDKKGALNTALASVCDTKISLGEKIIETYTEKPISSDMEINALWMQILTDMGLEATPYSKGISAVKNKEKFKKALSQRLKEGQK